MKSDVYRFEKNLTEFGAVTDVVDRIAAYNRLDNSQKLKLTLLAEELVEMLPNLLKYGAGEFWVENSGANYEIHAVVMPEDLLSSPEREHILSVSSTGMNAAAVGIMNKIKAAAEVMLANHAASLSNDPSLFPDSPYSFYDMGASMGYEGYSNSWSLSNYRENAREQPESWDELEKSIIANMADDVTVGILGGKVEIVIKKHF